MELWHYKAYKTDPTGNSINEIVEGDMEAINFSHLAVQLRQHGLQVIEGFSLNSNESLAAKRLAKMKARISQKKPTPITISSRIRRNVLKIISLLFRRRNGH